MTILYRQQWFIPSDQPMTVGLDTRHGGRWIGDYWYPCPFDWHRHVFHGAHYDRDVLAAEARCETPNHGGQLELPRPPLAPRRAGTHELAPTESDRDHHYQRDPNRPRSRP